MSLVVNLMASPAMLGEARYMRDWVTVSLVIIGIVLSSAFRPYPRVLARARLHPSPAPRATVSAVETAEHGPELTADELARQISTKKASSTWATAASLFGGLTLVCRLAKGRLEPETAFVRFCFVVRAAISAILGVMLATPTSVLLQNPAEAPGILWVTAAAMVVQVIIDVHVQNRSLKFNGLCPHTRRSCAHIPQKSHRR